MAVARREPREYVLPLEQTAGDVVDALGERFTVESDQAGVLDRTFFDTFDGRLVASGRLLERTGGSSGRELRLTTGGRPLAAAVAASNGALRLGDLPAGPVRDDLAPVIEVRALLPQVRVRSRVVSVRLCDGEEKTVVRVAIEEPVVIRRGAPPVPLATIVSVVPVLGYDKAFSRACRVLGDELGLEPPAEPLVARAVAAAGGVPGGVSSKPGVRLSPGMRADEATQRLCRRLADIVEVNLPGTLDDLDPEFLHDLRVAIRRTRSVLKEMRGVLPPADAARAKTDLRWIQEITGPTRDFDVQLEEWPDLVAHLPADDITDLQPLYNLLVEQRQQAFKAMRRQLRSARFADAWSQWRDTLAKDLPAVDDSDRPNASRPVIELAGGRIRTVYSHMVELGSAIDDSSPAEALHDLRKRGKELRYLLELFGQLWDRDVVDPMVSALKTLQDVLGTFQDDSVQAGHLRLLAPQVAADGAGTDLLLALGVVLNQLVRNQDAARRQFAERFESFATPRIRKQVRRTFKRLHVPKVDGEAAAPGSTVT